MLILNFSQTFKKQFTKLSETEKSRVIERLEDFSGKAPNLDIKKLNPKSSGFYRFRIGQLRLIYKFTTTQSVTFYEIRPRSKIY